MIQTFVFKKSNFDVMELMKQTSDTMVIYGSVIKNIVAHNEMVTDNAEFITGTK